MSSNNSRLTTEIFYKKAIRILKLAKKPKQAEIFSSMKILISSIIILGLIVYIIRILLFGILLGIPL